MDVLRERIVFLSNFLEPSTDGDGKSIRLIPVRRIESNECFARFAQKTTRDSRPVTREVLWGRQAPNPGQPFIPRTPEPASRVSGLGSDEGKLPQCELGFAFDVF